MSELPKNIDRFIHKIDKVATEMETLKQALLNSNHNWIAEKIDEAEANLIGSTTMLYILKGRLLKEES
jgi:hypothetical protein